MRRIAFCFGFLLVAGSFVLVLAAPDAAGKSAGRAGSFTVSQHGKTVGTAIFNVTPTARGYSSTSVVRVAMQGLNYSLSKTETLLADNRLRHAQLSAAVNASAVNVIAVPDARQILINISANGHSSTTSLALHSGAVFLADFDPGALDTLLALGAASNNRDLWAIVPKGAGSEVAVELATYADEQGTLDGKPVTVHHLVATIGNAVTDLFSGPENQLLQAELPQKGFALVRKGFVLTPSAKPGAPPVQ